MPTKPISFLERQSPEGLERIITRLTSGEPPMDTHFDKYLDVRFAHIEENLKELRADVKGWKLWVAGIGVTVFIGLTTIFIALSTYNANVMQTQLSSIQSQVSQYQSQLNAQMQVFSDYVKAVTQPQTPKPPKPSK